MKSDWRKGFQWRIQYQSESGRDVRYEYTLNGRNLDSGRQKHVAPLRIQASLGYVQKADSRHITQNRERRLESQTEEREKDKLPYGPPEISSQEITVEREVRRKFLALLEERHHIAEPS